VNGAVLLVLVVEFVAAGWQPWLVHRQGEVSIPAFYRFLLSVTACRRKLTRTGPLVSLAA